MRPEVCGIIERSVCLSISVEGSRVLRSQINSPLRTQNIYAYNVEQTARAPRQGFGGRLRYLGGMPSAFRSLPPHCDIFATLPEDEFDALEVDEAAIILAVLAGQRSAVAPKIPCTDNGDAGRAGAATRSGCGT